MNKLVINLINENKPLSFEEVIYPRLIVERQLGSYISEHRFYDIGTVERLNKFKEYLINKDLYHDVPVHMFYELERRPVLHKLKPSTVKKNDYHKNTL